MPAILSIGERLRRKMSIAAEANKSIEIKDLAVRYESILLFFFFRKISTSYRKRVSIRFALDVVGTVAFGLDVNTLENPDDSFRDMEKLVNNGQIINRIRLIGAFLCPW